MADLICWNCGKATGLEGRVMRSDQCPHCLADLRSCRGCRFFDPTARWQCRENIDSPVAIKEKSNFCDWYQVREAMHSHERKRSLTDSKEDRKKKFDDLFDD